MFWSYIHGWRKKHTMKKLLWNPNGSQRHHDIWTTHSDFKSWYINLPKSSNRKHTNSFSPFLQKKQSTPPKTTSNIEHLTEFISEISGFSKKTTRQYLEIQNFPSLWNLRESPYMTTTTGSMYRGHNLLGRIVGISGLAHLRGGFNATERRWWRVEGIRGKMWFVNMALPRKGIGHTYCWWPKSGINSPVEVGSLSHYLQGFIHPRWCRISSINSILPSIHGVFDDWINVGWWCCWWKKSGDHHLGWLKPCGKMASSGYWLVQDFFH